MSQQRLETRQTLTVSLYVHSVNGAEDLSTLTATAFTPAHNGHSFSEFFEMNNIDEWIDTTVDQRESEGDVIGISNSGRNSDQVEKRVALVGHPADDECDGDYCKGLDDIVCCSLLPQVGCSLTSDCCRGRGIC